VTGRQGKRRKQVVDELKETRGYWEFKEDSLYRTLWRNGFGRDYGPVARRTTE
jgi:hypothetical protein